MDKIIEITSSILTPLTAIIVVYITIKQYKLEKFNTKIDLYETRLPVYKSVMEFISKAVINANINLEDCFQLLRETSEKSFLFKSEVKNYIDELYKNGIKLNRANKMMDYLRQNPAKDEEYHKHRKEGDILIDWFSDQNKVADNIFITYLRIDRK